MEYLKPLNPKVEKRTCLRIVLSPASTWCCLQLESATVYLDAQNLATTSSRFPLHTVAFFFAAFARQIL